MKLRLDTHTNTIGNVYITEIVNVYDKKIVNISRETETNRKKCPNVWKDMSKSVNY